MIDRKKLVAVGITSTCVGVTITCLVYAINNALNHDKCKQPTILEMAQMIAKPVIDELSQK